MRTVWILGDQLHEDHPGLARADRHTDRVLFIESRKRSEQVRYHQLKLVLIFPRCDIGLKPCANKAGPWITLN